LWWEYLDFDMLSSSFSFFGILIFCIKKYSIYSPKNVDLGQFIMITNGRNVYGISSTGPLTTCFALSRLTCAVVHIALEFKTCCEVTRG
jgi:hypothetical protein